LDNQPRIAENRPMRPPTIESQAKALVLEGGGVAFLRSEFAGLGSAS
jgi:hypothetical protein